MQPGIERGWTVTRTGASNGELPRGGFGWCSDRLYVPRAETAQHVIVATESRTGS